MKTFYDKKLEIKGFYVHKCYFVSIFALRYFNCERELLILMGFKNRLKDIINFSGISISKFAEICGVSISSLQRYLDGKNEPKVSFLKRLASHFNVNLNWLLTGEGNPYLREKPTLVCLYPELPLLGQRYFLIPEINAKVASDLEDINIEKIVNWFALDYERLKQWGFSSPEQIKRLFILRMSDHGMGFSLCGKSAALIDTNIENINHIIPGNAYLIRRYDNTLCVRRLIYESQKIFCIPEDWINYKCYEIKVSSSEEISKYVLGKVIWFCRSFI